MSIKDEYMRELILEIKATKKMRQKALKRYIESEYELDGEFLYACGLKANIMGLIEAGRLFKKVIKKSN